MNRPFAPSASFRLAVADAVVIAAVFALLVRWITLVDPFIFFIDEGGGVRLLPLIGLMLIAMYFAGLYEARRSTSRIFLLQQISSAIGVSMFSQAMLSYIKDGWILPRTLALYGCVLSLFALFAWRMLWDAIVGRRAEKAAVLLLGTGPAVHRIAEYIRQSPGIRLRVAGTLTNHPEGAVQPVLGTPDDLREVVRNTKPEMVIAGFADARDRMPIAAMLDERFAGIRIEEASSACELICRRVLASEVRPSRTLYTNDFDAKAPSMLMTLTDKLTALVLLIFGAPFALIYAAAFRMQKGRSAFSTRMCAGFQGRVFPKRALIIAPGGIAASAARYLGLGEWPQTWSVLRGDMSMVGPRPERAAIARELENVFPLYQYRQNAKPGITGWARIHRPTDSGPVIDTVAEVEHDLYYLANQNFSLYTYILLHGLRSPA